MKPQHIVVASTFILLAVRLFHLVDLYAVNIFYWDQWKINEATLFQNHSWIEIFRWQYGPQRQGLGGIFSKLFGPPMKWNSRDEAFAMAAIIVCACLAAIWMKYRLFGNIVYSDVIIPLLFFTPVQYDSLVGTTNPSHGPLPLLLVVLYCLAWTITNSYWKYACVLVLNVLLIYTGFGLFMGLITPLLLGLAFYRDRNRLILISLAIAVISMVSFFIDFRFEPAVACFSPQLQNPLRYAVFVCFMFSSFVNIYPRPPLTIPATLMGSELLIFASLTAANTFLKMFRGKAGEINQLVISALLGYSLVFCFATAYGRICLGPAAAHVSRYMIYLVLAFFGFYLAALSAKVKIERRIFVCLVLLLALLSSTRLETQVQRSLSTWSQHRRDWRECYLSVHSIEQCDARTGLSIYWAPDLQSKLDYLQSRNLNLFSGPAAMPPERSVSISPTQ